MQTNYNIDNAKIVYTVDEIKTLLGVGKNTAYELVNGGVFPVRHVGKKIIISKVGFDNWLNCNDLKVS